MEENEVYKDIIGFPNYQISNYGNVKSLNYNRTGKEQILKPRKDKGGYLRVGLHKDGKVKNCQIHRLVALHFIPNPYNLPQVNHKDENKENNNVNNLEWCDCTYNINYGTRNEKNAKARINHPSISKKIIQYSLDGTYIQSFPSTMEIERQFGYSKGNISKCCNGKYKTAYGFLWKYA